MEQAIAARTSMGFANWARLALLVTVLGCVKRAPSGAEALEAAIRAVDKAWEARTENLDPVRQALLAAQAIDPESPEVAWRFARLEIAEGLMRRDPYRRIKFFSQARQHAWSCVMGDSVVKSVALESGLESALRRTKVPRQPCVSWAYLAWSRWYGDFGPAAASLDRARFRTLERVGTAFAGEGDRDRVKWASALVKAADGDPSTLSTIEDPVARIDEVRFGSEGADGGRVERLALRAPEARAYRAWVIQR